MPFATQPRERTPATGRACRAVVAVRQDHPGPEVAALRALQFAWFTTALPMDDDASIAEALGRVEGLDPATVVARLADDDVEAAYQEDRALARTAQGGPNPAEDVTELLDASPEGLTTREVAACMAPENAIADDEGAEEVLIAAAARGETRRETLGGGALWTAASAAAQCGA